MKHIVLALVAILALVACSQPTDSPSYYIYDSTWASISPEDLALKVASKSIGAREVSQAAALDAVEAYNATTTDDYLYVTDEETPIEEAPLADVYIADAGEVIASFLQISRADFKARRASFELEAQARGGTLYVDHVPPPPPEDTRTDYERYAVYLVRLSDDTIYLETHCEDWAAEGFVSIQARYTERLAAYQLEALAQGTLRVVYGQIYTPPA